MEKKSIRKEIADLINSIKEHSDNIGNSEDIPQLELELILSKIEKLYKKSIVYNHLHSSGKTTEKPLVTTETTVPIVKAEEKKISTDLFGSEISSVTEKPKLEKKVEKVPEKKQEVPVLQKIHKPSITDLRAAIGINDKFRFANELFAGVMGEYEIAIQQLNAAGSLESAMDYFMSLQPLYNWDMEHESVKRLLELVDRRYSE
jgi:hypothetical protein